MPGMFGQPEPLVVPAFGALRQIERIAEGQGASLRVQDRLRWTRAVSVELDLMQPARARRHLVDRRRQLLFDEAGDLSDAEVSQSLLNMARAYRRQANVLKAKQKSGRNRRR